MKDRERNLLPRYPEARVTLIGQDGNAGSIMGRVNDALRRIKVSKAEQDEFRMQAMSGNYDQLLQTVMEWVTVEDFEDEPAYDGIIDKDDLLNKIARIEEENDRLRAEIAAFKNKAGP